MDGEAVVNHEIAGLLALLPPSICSRGGGVHAWNYKPDKPTETELLLRPVFASPMSDEETAEIAAQYFRRPEPVVVPPPAPPRWFLDGRLLPGEPTHEQLQEFLYARLSDGPLPDWLLECPIVELRERTGSPGAEKWGVTAIVTPVALGGPS